MGVGERRGGRRAGGRRRAHHRHNHHHHRNRGRGRRNRHHRHHHGGRALFTFRLGNRAGGSGPGGGMAVTPGYYALLVILTMFGVFGFGLGMTLANIGGWTSTSLGIVGMVFLMISFTFVVIVVVIRCNMKKIPPNPQGGVEAGTMNPNTTVSTVTLEGSTTASQVSETTSYIIPTGAVQPGGVAMGTQPVYPLGPAQPYPQPPPQNYPGAPYPPHPNEATQYPPPSNPAAAPVPYPQPEAPPINYTTLYPAQPPPTHSHGGVVDPASDSNGLAPPPTYDDVMTGNVKYDEGSGAGSGPT